MCGKGPAGPQPKAGTEDMECYSAATYPVSTPARKKTNLLMHPFTHEHVLFQKVLHVLNFMLWNNSQKGQLEMGHVFAQQ